MPVLRLDLACNGYMYIIYYYYYNFFLATFNVVISDPTVVVLRS